jgi:hypothetical protein
VVCNDSGTLPPSRIHELAGADPEAQARVRVLQDRVFFTGGNRAVYRGYRCYRWGTVTVPSGSNRSQNSNLNLN